MERLHTFHIPVMGTGFTIDTPVRVARFGITSVVSLVDDHLIEAMRRYHAGREGEAYVPIQRNEPDARARRITAYLNLLKRMVDKQIEAVRQSSFSPDSALTQYLEWLPDDSTLKRDYRLFLNTKNPIDRAKRGESLRKRIQPGSIDVNIMTKADALNRKATGSESIEDFDASAALRGFARSELTSSVVFSAGLNPRLYDYLTAFPDFFEQDGAAPKKKVTLKVSDFRSGCTQAKFLAKKGVWISEYRIESGLNCGGHAFPTCGKLIGPILSEFMTRRDELIAEVFAIYREAVAKTGRPMPTTPLPIKISAQGGVGTDEEHRLLLKHFAVDSVGWGTPFLLVPEATSVDDETLKRLAAAGEQDVVMSRISPLGVPFYTLRNSPSEEARLQRIQEGRPGSPCTNGYMAYNTEFGEPLCAASARYQSLKVRHLNETESDPQARQSQIERVVEKACICRNLGDGALVKYGLQSVSPQPSPAVCPGPNLAYFSKIASLKEMVAHIYGRANLLRKDLERPHMFLKELKLYCTYILGAIDRAGSTPTRKEAEYNKEFVESLREGIEFYRRFFSQLSEETASARDTFLRQLEALKIDLDEALQARCLVTA